jgi:hypothetical protein
MLLDGSTLNISGDLHCIPGSAGPLVLSVLGGTDALHTEVTSRQRRGTQVFDGWIDVTSAIQSVATPGKLLVQLHGSDGTAIPVITLPGATESPNRAVIEPIARASALGRIARFHTATGLELEVSAIPATADIVGIGLQDSMITLEIGPFSPSPIDSESLDAVWLQRRGDRTANGSVEFTRGNDSRWRLEIDRRLLPEESDSSQIWDTWVSWRSDGERVTARAGRVSSDLVDLRDAVRLPTMRAHDAGVPIDVRPYYTISKHLAVKASVLETS